MTAKRTPLQNRLIEISETDNDVMVRIKSPSLRYLNEFFTLSCSKGLLVTEAFGRSNPAKEITEAFAMFRGLACCWDEGLKAFKRDDVVAIVAGDGVTPRLGATIALRSNWTVMSIDPTMHQAWVGPHGVRNDPHGIRRLTCVKERAEQCDLNFGDAEVVLALPHSHARAEQVIPRIRARRLHVVANPCCVATLVPGRPEPDKTYLDWGVHSEKRKIEIWRDVSVA